MKTLLLMRHAKSSWKDQDLSDIDRPLSKRGRRTAPLMGELIKEKELVPQLILSSAAVRARQTAEFFAAGAGFTGDIHYLDSLYLAEPSAYLGALSTVADEFERVMVIGHNPGLEGLLQMISGRIEALPTASLAFISLPIGAWHELSQEVEGELIALFNAPDLEEEKPKEKGKEKEKEKKKEHKEEKKEEKKEENKEEKKEEKKESKKEEKKGKK